MIGTPNANPVVVLSYDFWKTQLGGAPDVVGRKVLVNRHPMTVIGVAASTFRGIDVGEVPSLWIPASMSAQAIPGFQRSSGSPHALDAGAGPLEARYDVAESSGGAAAVVQGDVAGGYAPRRVSHNHGGAPAAVSQFVDRAHSGATGPFRPAAAAVGAALGAVRCDGSVVGSGLFECRRSLPGAWVGSRS